MAGEEVVKQGYELTQKKCENYGKQLSKLSVETFSPYLFDYDFFSLKTPYVLFPRNIQYFN